MKKNRLFLSIFTLCSLILFTAYIGVKEYNERLQKASVFLTEHSIFEDIYFSSQGEFLQKINLYKGEDYDSLHAYIPTSSNEPLRIYFNHCKSILFNGKMMSNGDLLPSVDSNVPYLVQAIDWENELFEENYITFYFAESIPTIYVTTESGNMEQIHSDENLKEAASYAVYTKDGNLDSAGQCSIKGRGNTSWSAEQKPYNLNLTSATSILGMANTSDWALLSNFDDDFPQLKNKLVFELAENLNLPFTPQGEFVNLYLNGQYNGLYLLTQRVSNTEGSVKIADGYLLEFDARYEEEPNHFSTPHQKVVIKAPDEVSEQQVAYITDYVGEAESAIFSDSGLNNSTGKSYLDYIDINSWSKIFSLQNYFVQWDVEFSSFYFYKHKADPHLYAGPVWDFDLSCGKMYLGNYPKLSRHLLWLEDTKSIWLRQLSKHDYFSDYVGQQYLSDISPAISQLLENEFRDIVTPLTSSVKMDALRWDKGDVSLDKEAANLYDWLTERQSFLDDYYANPDNYYSVTFSFAWGTVPYYIKRDTALGFLPYREYGEKEKFASLYGFEKIIGWMDESGKEVYAEDIITQNVTYYPIYQLPEE